MEQSLQQAVLDQSDIHMQKVKLGTYLILFTNIKFKLHHRPTYNQKATKFIVDNIVETKLILGMTITFWIKTPQAKSMKELIDNLDFIKIKISALQKTLSREGKDKPGIGRKYLQKTYLIKENLPEYIKKS